MTDEHDPMTRALLDERAATALWAPENKAHVKAIDAQLKALGVTPPKGPRAQRATATAGERRTDHSEDSSGDEAPGPTGQPGDPGSA